VFHGILVSSLERLDEDGSLAPACLDGAIGDLGARFADGEECVVCVFDTGVVLEVAVVFEEVESAVEFG
jgi:hypothetical protein